MANRTPFSLLCILLTTLTLAPAVSAQSHDPYPHAVTDRLIHLETPMLPPPRNVVFADPDFGSSIVRATDASTNIELSGTFLRTEGSGEANEWSADTRKFYVIDKGGQSLVFAFDPATMAISSLPNAMPGQGLLLPLRAGASFSFKDPDLIYGTSDSDTLTIRSYDFSTGTSTAVIDTTTCGLQPPLVSGPSVVSDDDVTPSLDDNRVSISEGGSQFGDHMFVLVFEKHLGCRWYNTQTGQVGGGATATPFLIRHAYLSRSGKYVVLISTNGFGWHVWDLATLNVSSCPTGSLHDKCDGYQAVGYESLVNGQRLPLICKRQSDP